MCKCGYVMKGGVFGYAEGKSDGAVGFEQGVVVG